LVSGETRLAKPSHIFGFQYSGFQAARHSIYEMKEYIEYDKEKNILGFKNVSVAANNISS
jgi:hypothetical protein